MNIVAKRGILLLLFVLAIDNCSLRAQVASKVDCFEVIKRYSNSWIWNSLSKNGFRERLGWRYLMKCNCEDRKWSLLRRYLGKPTFTYREGKLTTYRYRLNHYTEEIKDIGTLLLDVDADNSGTIKLFAVYEIDG